MYKLHLNKTDHHRGQLNFCNQQKFANEYIISVIQYQAIFSEVQTHDFCSDANGFQCRNPKDLKFSTEQKTNFREFEVFFVFFPKNVFPNLYRQITSLIQLFIQKTAFGPFRRPNGISEYRNSSPLSKSVEKTSVLFTCFNHVLFHCV